MAWKNKTPKQPKVRGPKDVQPMNKKTKSVLVWTTTGVVLAGVTVGITVPLVLASQKETDVHAFDADGNKDKDLINVMGEWMTWGEFQSILDKVGLADASLLNELSYQASFYLYEKEEKGSLDYQMMKLKWEQYNMALGTGLGEEGDLALTTDELKNAAADNLHEIAKIRKTLVLEFGADYTNDASGQSFERNRALTSNGKFLTKSNGGTQIKEGIEVSKPNPDNIGENNYEQADYDSDLAKYNKYNDLQSQLETKKDLFNKNVDRINKLQITIDNRKNNTNNSGGIDYNSKDFSTDYPQILLPIKNIRDKQTKIFNEARDGVIASRPTREEGLLEWSKQMPDKYNGATTDQDAIDYLVNTQVSTSAFTRFNFSINSEYTFEQYQSGIFASILGEPQDADDSGIAAAKKSGVGIKKDSELTDKVYFFATGSKEIESINALRSSEISDYITEITTGQKLISINNAIFPVKQGTSSDAPWVVTKEDLIKLFSSMGSGSDLTMPIGEFGKIFSSASTEEKDDALIAWGSGTTDGTQWKGGDLGLMPTFGYINGMTNGWAAGVTAVMSQAGAPNPATDSIYQGTPNALQDLTDVMVLEFYNLAIAKARLGLSSYPALPGTSRRADATQAYANMKTEALKNIAQWNLNVKDFINSLTDEEIARTFGAAIRDFFNTLPAERSNGVTAGLPVAIQIEPLDITLGSDTGIYMTFTEEFGIHVMKFNWGPQSVINLISEDLLVAAEKQSTEDITTDYAKLITDKLTQARKLQLIMGDTDIRDDSNPFYKFLSEQIANDKLNINVDGLDGDDEIGGDEGIWQKAVDLIESINKSAEITEINSAPASTLSSWLMTRIDNRLSMNPNIAEHSTMTPEEIYNDFVRIGGIR